MVYNLLVVDYFQSVDPGTLSNLPKDLAMLVVIGGLVVTLIRVLTPLNMILKDQHEARIVLLEASSLLTQKSLSALQTSQNAQMEKLDTLINRKV